MHSSIILCCVVIIT